MESDGCITWLAVLLRSSEFRKRDSRPLFVAIDEQYVAVLPGKSDRQIDGQRGFPNATFDVSYSDNHLGSSFRFDIFAIA